MRWMVVLAFGVTACGVSKSEHEALRRQVASQEKRLRQLEGRGGKAKHRGKGGKRHKAGKGKAGKRKQAPPKGKVAVTGDAHGVFVASERHRLPVPGSLRAGTFKALAVFESGASATEVGPITIEAGKTTTIDCVVAEKRCQITGPE